MTVLLALLPVCFTLWAIALAPYGDASARGHLPFYAVISTLGFVFVLALLPLVALVAMALADLAFAAFYASWGGTSALVVAADVMLVTGPVFMVVFMHKHDFERLTTSKAEAEVLISRIGSQDREQKRLLRMLDDMPVAVMTVDPETLEINYVNRTSKGTLRQIEHLLPIAADSIIGTSIDVFHAHPAHQRGILADPRNLPHHARIRLGPEVLDLQVSAVTADDGSYMSPMLTWAVVTKEVEAENRILQLARYDTLTGLANRATFDAELAASLVPPCKDVGLLFIDLDGFKLINDTWGHHFGDMVLKQVASRMRAVCGTEGMTIARLGGDEFAVLVPQSRFDHASRLAGTLIEALSAPYQLEDGRQVSISASIGIALAPCHGEDTQTLLARADIALYFAKSGGKRNHRMFQPEMEHKVQEHVRLEAKLRAALETKEGLFVFYQPIVNIESGKVTSREALMRWHHPLRGWIPPSEFIPVAEQSGLAEPLGAFVLERACREATTWADGETVAVNVSACQLGRGRLPAAVRAALAKTGLAPNRLELEVTETALLNDEQDSIADLSALRDMGVRVALDDFGTGYSSLAHLRAFPFDKIKIDGSFVRDAVTRPDCAAVIRSVADLGKSLGVTTVAESVETDAQLACVARDGCVEAQGYLFGAPRPTEADAPRVAQINEARTEKTAS